MEFAAGSTLKYQVEKQYGKITDEEILKTYIAEITLALEDLHKRNILYRDMKPENICLDA